MIGATQDRDLAGFELHFLRVQHEHDLTFEHDAEVEGAGLLHVGMGRERGVGGGSGRSHGAEERLDFGCAYLAFPRLVRRIGIDPADRAPRGRLESVGQVQRLAKTSERPQLPWTFTVVDQPVVNAFAVPGGFIYITRGILAYLDNEA